MPLSFSVASEKDGGEEGMLERLFVWVGAHGLVLVFHANGEWKKGQYSENPLWKRPLTGQFCLVVKHKEERQWQREQ